MFRRKEEILSAQVSITFLRLENVSVKSNTKYYIQWKRGSKKENQGKLKPFDVTTGRDRYDINETIEFQSTFAKRGKKYDEKYISIALKDINDVSIGKILLNLSDYVTESSLNEEMKALNKKKPPNLFYKVSITVLKESKKKKKKKKKSKSNDENDNEENSNTESEYTYVTDSEISDFEVSVDELDESMMEDIKEEKKNKKRLSKKESLTESSSDIIGESSSSVNTPKKRKSKKSNVKIDDLYDDLPDFDDDDDDNNNGQVSKSNIKKSKEDNNELNDMKSRISDLERKYKNSKLKHKREIALKNDEISNKSSYIDELNENIKQMKENEAKLMDRIKLLEDSLNKDEHFQLLINEKDELIKQYKSKEEENNKMIYDLKSMIESIKDDYKSIKDDVNDKYHSYDNEMKALNDLISNIPSYNNDDNSHIIEKLNFDIEERDIEIKHLKEDVKYYKDKSQEELDDINNSYIQLKQDYLNVLDRLEKEEEKYSLLCEEFDKLKDENDRLVKLLSSKDNDNDNSSFNEYELLQLKEDIKRKYNEIDQIKSSLNDEINRLNEIINDKDNTIKNLTDKMDELVEEVKSKSNIVSMPIPLPTNNTSNNDNEYIKELERLIEQKNEEYQSLKDDFDDLERENHELTEKLDQFKESDTTVYRSNRMIDILKQEREEIERTASQQIDDLNDEINILKNKLLRIKKALSSDGNESSDNDSDLSDDDEYDEYNIDEDEIISSIEKSKSELMNLREKIKSKGIPNDRFKEDINMDNDLFKHQKIIMDSIYSLSLNEDELSSSIDKKLSILSDHLLTMDKDTDYEYFSMVINAFRHQSTLSNDFFYYIKWINHISFFIESLKEDDSELKMISRPEDIQNYNNNYHRFTHEMDQLFYDLFINAMELIHSKVENLIQPSILEMKNIELKRIIGILNSLKNSLKKMNVRQFITHHIIIQLLYFINSNVFNRFMEKNSIYCKVDISFNIKLQLTQIEDWAVSNYPLISEELKDTFNYTYEAINIIVWNKDAILDDDVKEKVYPHLNIAQLYSLMNNFYQNNDEKVNQEIMKKIQDKYNMKKRVVYLDKFLI